MKKIILHHTVKCVSILATPSEITENIIQSMNFVHYYLMINNNQLNFVHYYLVINN